MRRRTTTVRGAKLCDGTPLKITEVRFLSASAADVECGLLGWASCVLNGAVRLDGITVRRTLSGHLAVSFPTRTDRWGSKHEIVQPLNGRVRRELQHQILLALRLQEGAHR